jgi:hypothetical protein
VAVLLVILKKQLMVGQSAKGVTQNETGTHSPSERPEKENFITQAKKGGRKSTE